MQFGLVAQWLEQGSHKPQVLGSIPSGPIQQKRSTPHKGNEDVQHQF